MDFSKQLILWYLQNKRDLPWRKDTNPYQIWLSEIILQQTRISQGIPYYFKFIRKYPTIFDLASAEEDEVLKLWQGLGYYSRGRNLHHTARYITTHFNGIFPNDFKTLKKLRGIGDYTASAISSICFNQAHAAVDGNVQRVLARFFNINTPVNSTKGIKYFKELAQELIDPAQPGTYNQAVMELGALICTPKNPQCTVCPLQEACKALKHKTIEIIPVKEKKIRRRKRFFNFLVFNINNSSTLLVKRTEKDIWQNLFQFPLIETKNEAGLKDIVQSDLLNNLIGTNEITVEQQNFKPLVHKLTHQDIQIQFWVIKTQTTLKNAIKWKNVINFAVPTPIDNFIKSYQK
ncbi:MAG: A/G-specific adenine glycosylase [Flavobacteriia bacterium]|nr:MAG: A/G-specific adenine glycosylase [Flavobacteriia bacterium]